MLLPSAVQNMVSSKVFAVSALIAEEFGVSEEKIAPDNAGQKFSKTKRSKFFGLTV